MILLHLHFKDFITISIPLLVTPELQTEYNELKSLKVAQSKDNDYGCEDDIGLRMVVVVAVMVVVVIVVIWL